MELLVLGSRILTNSQVFRFLQARSLQIIAHKFSYDLCKQSLHLPLSSMYNIELRHKNQKQPRTTISVPMIYVGMTSKIKLKALLSTPMLELQYEY